ncbi:MAG: hypothetical protein Q9214_001212, partial [Letrouitia sp. 1 TL-2023]
MYDMVVWSGAEDFVIILCGSAPTLKPLWDRCHGNGEPLTPRQFRSRIAPDLEKNNASIKRLKKKQPSSELSQCPQQQESDQVDEYKKSTTTEFRIESERA